MSLCGATSSSCCVSAASQARSRTGGASSQFICVRSHVLSQSHVRNPFFCTPRVPSCGLATVAALTRVKQRRVCFGCHWALCTLCMSPTSAARRALWLPHDQKRWAGMQSRILAVSDAAASRRGSWSDIHVRSSSTVPWLTSLPLRKIVAHIFPFSVFSRRCSPLPEWPCVALWCAQALGSSRHCRSTGYRRRASRIPLRASVLHTQRTRALADRLIE